MDYDLFLSSDPIYRLSEFFYRFGDETIIPSPKLVKYSDFLQEGVYFFLQKCKPYLPLEIWYLIFEWKFIMEKKDYIEFLFHPNSFKTLNHLHLHTSDNRDRYFIPRSPTALMHNDCNNVSIFSHSPEGRQHQYFNILLHFKKFISQWYIWLKLVATLSRYDLVTYSRENSYQNTYFGEKIQKSKILLLSILNLFCGTENKIDNLYNTIIIDNRFNCCHKHNQLAKIFADDMKYFAEQYSEDCFEGHSLEEHPNCNKCISFHYYFYDFEEWIKYYKIEQQVDLISLVESLDPEEDYINPYWFQKDNPEDDFPLWTMFQEFCY
jgi:hypothetical protein